MGGCTGDLGLMLNDGGIGGCTFVLSREVGPMTLGGCIHGLFGRGGGFAD